MKPALLILGLGNPGKSYARTRHNAGFRAVDALADEWGTADWKEQSKFRAATREARLLTIPILFAKPLTYMNDSGEAAKKLTEFYKLDPATKLLVVVDDIDLPLGDIRFRASGGPGTHNGLKSLVTQFGEAFPRIRIGLGEKPVGEDLAAWVLSSPSAKETALLSKAERSLGDVVRKFVLERAGSDKGSEESAD